MQPGNSLIFPLLGYFALVNCASGYHNPEGKSHQERQTGNPVCAVTQPTTKAPRKNIWACLTNQEVTEAIDFLYKSNELNLTKTGGSWDNSIVSIDLLQPNKTDVLPYLADTKPAPSRYARAMLMFGNTKEPYMQEWMVGPLPISNQTKAQPLTFLSTRKSDNKLRVYNADFDAVGTFNENIMSQAANAIKALWNVNPDAVSITTVSPTQVDSGHVTVWQGFMGNPSGRYDTGTLLPLGLYVRSDMTGRDPSKWKIEGWLYNNIFYKTIDEFSKALAQPGFKKLGMVVDGPWAQLDKQGDALPFDDLPPPASVQPGPKRFSFDANENFLSWMDFTFYITVSRDMGVRLFDLKYKGKRILYELGMEEALAHYSGIDPIQSGTCYFDTMYGFGSSIVSLVNGYDCPSHSTYVNIDFLDGTTRRTQPNGICMFEMDRGFPIQRHSGGGFTSVTKNIAFMLRSVTTVGNYDYQTTYEFHMDGSITVAARASGYIQSGYFSHNEEYGFQIHDNLSGSMHDHVLTFKADFDILGEKNSLQKVEFVPTTETYVWNDGKPRNTMKAKKTFITNENEAKIDWSPNGDSLYAIVNTDAKNNYGENPGYRFMPAAGVAHLTVQNSSITQNAANHADRHFYVTKQKETEARASHPYNLLDPADPAVNFAKYFDGESLTQQDLVLWFNLGMHHMPHSGDLPNTVFSTAYSALTIEPLNYLPGDPSRATAQQIRVDNGNNGTQTVVTFGAKPASCAVGPDQLNPNTAASRGSLAVHKYPYDGTQPNRIG
ncbi:copper amine oxidase [Bisporella sp. PMI_857]|nr:copper amine oxidase [Bisporella sp. PMI_857]